MLRGDRNGRKRSYGMLPDPASGSKGRPGRRVARLAVVAFVAATALSAIPVAAAEPARATAVGEVNPVTYADFRRQAENLVDALIEADILQNLRGRVGRRDVDRLVEHWRRLERMSTPADQVAYILDRFNEARARIDATLRQGGPNEAVGALAAGPRSPVMEALYMAIVASALEEGRPAFKRSGGSSELDGILASFGASFWLIRLVYWIDFPAAAEYRFTRGFHQLARQRNLKNAGPAPTPVEG